MMVPLEYTPLAIFVLIGIDIAIMMVLYLVIRRTKSGDLGKDFSKPMEALESLIAEGDQISAQLRSQMQERQAFLKRLNANLDKRILSLRGLLRNADVLVSACASVTLPPTKRRSSLVGKEKNILSMAKKGHELDEIADRLSIPQQEVKLVLDLEKKCSELNMGKGEF